VVKLIEGKVKAIYDCNELSLFYRDSIFLYDISGDKLSPPRSVFAQLDGDGKKSLKRVAGIEPATKAWEAFILPLNYTRIACCNQE
jgi:hypothetical protein